MSKTKATADRTLAIQLKAGAANAFVNGAVLWSTVIAPYRNGASFDKLLDFALLYLVVPNVVLALAAAVFLRIYFGSRNARITDSAAPFEKGAFAIGNFLIAGLPFYVLVGLAFEALATSGIVQ